MGDSNEQYMKERFGDYVNPSINDDKPNPNEPVFGSRYTSHDMPKTK